MEFALLKDGQFQEIRKLDARPPDAPHKGFTWLPVFRKEGPEEFTGAREETVEGKAGAYWVIATLSPEFRPAPPIEVPESITRRQCALQLLDMQMITPEEALAMTKDGSPPAAILETLVKHLAPDQVILAQIDMAAGSYYRDNKLLGLMGMGESEIDAFFIAAAKR